MQKIREFIGRVPDRPPLREQFKLACGPAFVMITRLVPRSTGCSGSSVSFGLCSRERSVVGGVPPFSQWVRRRSGVVWFWNSEFLFSSSLQIPLLLPNRNTARRS
jgi:hypothetical protein